MPKGNSINGKIVRELRRKLHMTQPTLAGKIKASIETVKRIEKSDVVDVGLELIPRLAEALGTTTEKIEVVNGQSIPPLPDWASQFKTLAEAHAALERAWNDSKVKKAAKPER